ncbi:WD repeat domain phosphoinositide-interacting protein 3 [Gaertneriomyces sp. JEL0708]|nr:WD repeat domain phosphoinositide-interacting protein 3 [Gaertneriomyces sp. JEL0708]
MALPPVKQPVWSLNPSGIRHISLNSSTTCFAITTQAGYRVYSINPLVERARFRQDDTAGFTRLTAVEMFDETNLLLLVDGQKVTVWDAATEKAYAEWEFTENVTGVKVSRERIVIATMTKVHLHAFLPTPAHLQTYTTCANPLGLLSLVAPHALAFPAVAPGQVQLLYLSTTPTALSQPPPSTLIPAHTSALSRVVLSPSGRFLATASDKGTLIRVFDTKTCHKTHELRRGADKASIYCIAFNSAETRVCVASDKGTVHIFNLAHPTGGPSDRSSTSSRRSSHNPPTVTPSPPSSPLSTSPRTITIPAIAAPAAQNRSSLLSSLSPYLPKYFSSEWSFAHCRIPPDIPFVCAFAPLPDVQPSAPSAFNKEAILILCYDGSMYWFTIDDTRGGDTRREAYRVFFKADE